MYFAALNTSLFVPSAVKTPTKLVVTSIIVIYTFLHNLNLFPRCPKRAIILIKFKSHLLTPKNISILSANLVNNSSHLRNPKFDLISINVVTTGSLNNQPVLWGKYKTMIFRINQIQTAVKSIITTILSKASSFSYITISYGCYYFKQVKK